MFAELNHPTYGGVGRGMASRTLFYRCARGRNAQSVDSWFLIKNDDHNYWIEHSWSHCEQADRPTMGTETLSVAEVLLNVDDAAVLAGFKAVLTNDVNNLAAASWSKKNTDGDSEVIA